jgi:predicted nucleic acid-binding protein
VNEIVVDASVSAKWWFAEEYRREAILLLERRVPLAAPAFVQIELSSLILKKLRLGMTDIEGADLALRSAFRMPVRLVPDLALLSQANALARSHHPSVYDCLYAALAIREQLPLVTADRRFYEAILPVLGEDAIWIADLPAYLERLEPAT